MVRSIKEIVEILKSVCADLDYLLNIENIKLSIEDFEKLDKEINDVERILSDFALKS